MQKSDIIMKTYEINTCANQLKANAEVKEKTFLDFYNDVKDGRIVPVTNECEDIVGFNVVKPTPSSMKVCKMVNGQMTVGDTEEDRVADEVAMRKFMEEYSNCNLMQWFLAAQLFVKSNITVDDIVDVEGDIYAINADARKVINLRGETVVDLSDDEDIEEGTPKKLVIKLLKAAVNADF